MQQIAAASARGSGREGENLDQAKVGSKFQKQDSSESKSSRSRKYVVKTQGSKRTLKL